jgi:RNA polymerase sigma factor (sigma-70 family)
LDRCRHPGKDQTVVVDASRLDTTLEAVYRTQWVRLARLGWLMTGSREDAEDIVQDAFVGLERAWAGVQSPGAYLHRSVVNLVRARARHREVTDRHPPDEPAPILPPEIDETWRLLLELPPRQRHAIVLRFYEDMSVEEIALHLECGSGTVKSLIHRGLRKLEQCMT